MNTFKIHISNDAQADLDDLYYTILLELKAPTTAFKYLQELKNTIKSLSKTANTFQIQTRASLQQYGINVRRINYKRMTIIYTIHSDIVYIHRIVSQSMITGL